MDLSILIEQIASRRRFGMKPGLDRMIALLDALNHPEQSLACVHIAGTNGKGSVSAMIAAVLEAAGYGPIGRYTSPHLVFFNERIAINGTPVSNDVLQPSLERLIAALPPLDAKGLSPTFFECATALAFDVFHSQGVRLAVIETGLGGRLDATNVITPILSVITNIGLEHCEYLGDSIEKIASEKAGIIKRNRPVVTGLMDFCALSIILARAQEMSAPTPSFDISVSSRSSESKGLTISFEDSFRTLSSIPFPLNAPFQLENLQTAICALEVFAQTTGLPLPDDAFRLGLSSVSWPCRFQCVTNNPPIIVDGAHNPPATTALAKALAKQKMPFALVAGFCDDKDCLSALRPLKPFIQIAWATETPSARSLSANQLLIRLQQAGFRNASSNPNWKSALHDASRWALDNHGAVIVCGSLFLAGAVADFSNALPWQKGARLSNELLKPSAL